MQELLKNSVEKLYILISHTAGNFTDRSVTSGQQLTAPLHADLLHILPKGHAGILLEASADIGYIIMLSLAEGL